MIKYRNDYCGILLVNKPAGFTSFDVIAKLRGILKMRRLGHSGTLDPIATGVLPIFAGKATVACSLLPNEDKAYIADFILGSISTTQDSTGEILFLSNEKVTIEQLKNVASQFLGEIMQKPPMYSAASVGGKRLYELARKGIEVDRKPKKRMIYKFDILEFDEINQKGKAFIQCSKGTYIRTLIHDMGRMLGTGGLMTGLQRTMASGFTLENCFTIDEVTSAVKTGLADRLFIPIENVFTVYPSVMLDEEQKRLYTNGVRLSASRLNLDFEPSDEQTVRVKFNDTFLGLAKLNLKTDELISSKNFYK